jgi:hypothetical protein
LAAALLLGLLVSVLTWRVSAQGAAPLAFRTVYGKLELVNDQRGGVIVVSDDGQRMAWRFNKAVLEEVAHFKPGAPVVVIYRERGGDKVVTAIAFPGAAASPVYVNTTGERVELVSGPMLNGTCGQRAESPPHTTTIPIGGQAETSDACWCCAPAGESCTPANKTGLGKAFLARCYE